MSGSNESSKLVSETSGESGKFGKGVKERRKRASMNARGQEKVDANKKSTLKSDSSNPRPPTERFLATVNNKKKTPLRKDAKLYPRYGEICAFCYCEPNSLLRQGNMVRYSPTPNFNPFRKPFVRQRQIKESSSSTPSL